MYRTVFWTLGEGEGGMIWENGIEICIISHLFSINENKYQHWSSQSKESKVNFQKWGDTCNDSLYPWKIPGHPTYYNTVDKSELLWIRYSNSWFLLTNVTFSSSVVNWSSFFHNLTTQQCPSMVLVWPCLLNDARLSPRGENTQNKISHCFHCFPIYLARSDGTRCHGLHCLNVEFWSAFSLSSFTYQEALYFFFAFCH